LVGLSTKIFKNELPLPLGTLIVNVVGCLLIGILATLAEEGNVITPQARNFLVIGILGAFTTFSTFGYESIALLRNESLFRFIANLVVQLVLGLARGAEASAVVSEICLFPFLQVLRSELLSFLHNLTHKLYIRFL